MAPAVNDADGFVTLDQAADQPEFVKIAPEPGQVLAKPLGLFGKHTEKKTLFCKRRDSGQDRYSLQELKAKMN